ncbi:DUF2933 domain-containing protein [Zobellella taiwanensis]|jgi:hypothetical protein|uniref:DUF2933 domain-containing protein n=1 Tax=Zobellella taiwanensis TaxID=347535 RepID=A0A2P7R4F2_9GAMM|nr:DUF2933 domain-containing protein [Zobellella taiwanensis]PSJ45102.1 hypothetical protein C7I36_05715 [Zobellella taiwanensis]
MNKKPSFLSTPRGWLILGVVASLTYFLLVEHKQHLFIFLPYLIFLLCPLMHLFMHRGHKHGEHHHHDPGSDESKEEAYRRGLEQGRREAKHKPED